MLRTLEPSCSFLLCVGLSHTGSVAAVFVHTGGTWPWAEVGTQDTSTAQSKLASALSAQGLRRLNSPSSFHPTNVSPK